MNEFVTKGDLFFSFILLMGCFAVLGFGHVLETHRLHRRIDELERGEKEAAADERETSNGNH